VQYGRFLLFKGQIAEGLRQFLVARSTEPASALVRSWVAYSYYLQNEMDSAIVESRRAFQSDSTNLTTLAFGALILLKANDVATARDYLRRMSRYQIQAL
jgi:Tfp pilus assembly protein PilF